MICEGYRNLFKYMLIYEIRYYRQTGPRLSTFNEIVLYSFILRWVFTTPSVFLSTVVL